ncbi:unnamed protein product [Durusdinium trenchii]|uniref:Uncharacterized protein n=1 Tax=Durusdinium trenchii TaxID=1381693 RepID=A0ABP0QXD1_9DINO
MSASVQATDVAIALPAGGPPSDSSTGPAWREAGSQKEQRQWIEQSVRMRAQLPRQDADATGSPLSGEPFYSTTGATANEARDVPPAPQCAAGAAAPKLVAPGSGGSLKRMTRVEELQEMDMDIKEVPGNCSTATSRKSPTTQACCKEAVERLSVTGQMRQEYLRHQRLT